MQQICALFGEDAKWRRDSTLGPHEAHFLALDCSRAHRELGWRPQWLLGTALEKIVDWHRAYMDGKDVREVTLSQIREYQVLSQTGDA